MPVIRLGLLVAIMIVVSGQSEPARPAYAAGQVWQYRTRPGDEGSLLRIATIEVDPAFGHGEPIFHISLIGVHGLGQASDRDRTPARV